MATIKSKKSRQSDENKTELVLRRIVAKGLFGKFNYDLSLKADGITILTGPNGYGKTTLLMAVFALATGNFDYFERIDFERFEFHFDDGNFLVVDLKDKLPRLNLNNGDVIKGRDKIESYLSQTRLQSVHLIKEQRLIGFPVRNKGYDEIPLLPLKSRAYYDIVLERIKASMEVVPDLLENRFENNYEEIILNDAAQLREHINHAQDQSARIGQELDGSFPKRLFDEVNEINEIEFNRRFEFIRDVQKELVKFDLLQSLGDDHPSYKKENANALFVYLKDTERKLEPYRALLRKLELFTTILNKRRFSFKKIVINRKHGFQVQSEKGSVIPLSDLSSGEKHQIVMLYELIFKARPGTLVLIDEPELSLHVAWQKAFLDDLASVIKINPINALIATHSPQIINGHWEMTVDLWEKSQ